MFLWEPEASRHTILPHEDCDFQGCLPWGFLRLLANLGIGATLQALTPMPHIILPPHRALPPQPQPQ